MSEQNFAEENEELKNKLLQNLAQLQKVTGIAVKLEKRIYEMESSVFWRARLVSQRVWQHFKRTLYFSTDNSLWFEKVRYFLSKHVVKYLKKFFKILFKNLYLLLEDQPVKIVPINLVEINSREILYRIHEEVKFFSLRPLISIIMPVYNTPVQYLKEAIESVKDQYYPHWELCIADDNSSNQDVIELLKEYQQTDSRIKVVFRNTNGHISVCSNSALEIAVGEYVALMDHDDLLTPNALHEVVRQINLHPEADFIYSDEDKLQADGSFVDPYYKPDWCPDSFLARNYITHFSVIRRSLVVQVGLFREGYEGSQDYDLFLRVTELTNNIFHIPQILYHWRIHQDSTALYSSAKVYAYEAAQKALSEALVRRKCNAVVDANQNISGYYTVRYKPQTNHKVSIIIPTKDKSEILKTCLESIFALTSYANFEVIVVSNNSTEADLFTLLTHYTSLYPEKFQYYENNIPFNFSKLMNDAVSRASGDILLLLNNDTEVIQPDWICEMLGQVERPSIGAVGCKLLYPDDTVQHAGVVIGLGGAAGHVFAGEHKQALGYFCQLSTINNYSAVTGACLMCRKIVYEEVGGFDEDLKIEFNDIDFCLKLIECGYYNIYLPQVELYHHESLSRGYPLATKKSSEIHSDEAELFIKRWQKYIDHDPCFSIHFSRQDANYRIEINS